jgi:hypothetical protein
MNTFVALFVVTVVCTTSINAYGQAKCNTGDNIHQAIITGRVTDSAGNPIAGTTVKVCATAMGTAAATDGSFYLNIPARGNVLLEISCVGFKSRSITVQLPVDSVRIDITLQDQALLIDELVVACSRRRRGCPATGYSLSYRKDTLISPTPAMVSWTIFPNPAIRGQFVNVQPANPGSYELLMLDNASRSILQKRFTITGKRQSYQLELPSNISAGIYYLSMIDEATKQQLTQKLIVQ